MKSTLGPYTTCPARTPDCWPPPGFFAPWAFPLWPPPIFPSSGASAGLTRDNTWKRSSWLQTACGDCPEDLSLLGNDPCLERGLGFPLPKVGAVRSFLRALSRRGLGAIPPPARGAQNFIVPSSAPVEGLQAVQAGVVRRIAQLYAERQTALRIATVDQDATISRESQSGGAGAL